MRFASVTLHKGLKVVSEQFKYYRNHRGPSTAFKNILPVVNTLDEINRNIVLTLLC